MLKCRLDQVKCYINNKFLRYSRFMISVRRTQFDKWRGESPLFDERKYVCPLHYSDVIMSTTASQITNLTIVYSIVYSGADEGKHQSSASLAFVRGIHRWPVNSPHKWPVTRKMFHLMTSSCWHCLNFTHIFMRQNFFRFLQCKYNVINIYISP